ncbi:MAG: hypothetical protein PVG65_01025 [Candidatus Thorarchaeota archaeon]|jgi:hypothetical protein
MAEKYTKSFADRIFREFGQRIKIYLRGTKTKSARYDKYTDVGYTTTKQNYYSPKAIVRDAQSNELILKNIGKTVSEVKKLVVEDRVIDLLKNSEKLVIGDYDYYVYDDAVGNKLQILGDSFGYTTIMVFRKEI